MPDDEIATLLPTNVGAPIGRGDAIGSSVRGLTATACRSMKISNTATLGDGCNQLTVGWGCPKSGSEFAVFVQ
ncbi:MAG: hypothetical protein M3Y35_15420 [Actinomycetota bacterium]|nr:hypothetical protein [Actinomycetota bacterium]